MEEHKSEYNLIYQPLNKLGGETHTTWFTPLEIQNQYEIKGNKQNLVFWKHWIAWDSGYYENQMKVPEGECKKPTMEVEGQGGWWQGQSDSWGNKTKN